MVDEMKEIIDFIIEELNISVENKRVIDDGIRTIRADLESMGKTIDDIISNQDDTNLVFLSASHLPKFEVEEVIRLKQQKSMLSVQLEELNKRAEKEKNRIEKLETLIEGCKNHQNKMSGLEVITVQEADRQRIARDIHDTVVQNLTALSFKNEFILGIIDTDLQRAKFEIQSSNKTLKDSIEELRNIIFDLRPMILGDFGFEKTFYNLMNKIDNSTNMLVDYNIDLKGHQIHADVSIQIVRIIYELCNNSIKHSKGNIIKVCVYVENDNLIIVQSDDGIGYDSEKEVCIYRNNTGFGLPMLKERVALLWGTVSVISNHETGSKYVISIPICEESKDVSKCANSRGPFNG